MKPLDRSLIGHRTPRGYTRVMIGLLPPGDYFYRFELAEHVVLVPTIFARARRSGEGEEGPVSKWAEARRDIQKETRRMLPPTILPGKWGLENA